MAEYMNEQEQVELIKSLWKKYGAAFFTALFVVILALTGWQIWQKRKAETLNAASVDYQYLLQESQAGENHKVETLAKELMSKYPETPYSGMVALFMAEQEVGDKKWGLADQHLTFAQTHLKQPLREIAVLRLARVKAAEGQPQAALDLLKEPENQFKPLFLMVSGDVYLSLKNPEKAKACYQGALSALNQNSALPLNDSSITGINQSVRSPLDILKSALQAKLNATS